MASWLSQNTTISVSSCYKQTSRTKPFNQIASFIAFVPTIYSASIVHKAIIDYKIDFQLMTQPDSVKT